MFTPATHDPAPSTPRHLLLVEDDALLVRLVQRVLAAPDYTLDVAYNAESGRQQLLGAGAARFDAVLLDVELPDQSGLDLLRDLRAAGDATPVLILTGQDTDEDVVRGLDAGADDYLVKPVGPAVLKARLRAAWRRAGDATRVDADGAAVPHHVGVLTLGGLVLNRLTRRVTMDDRELDLTPKEFALLEHLLLRPEETVSRGELLDQVWQLQGDPGSNVVDAHVARLRQKLRAAAPCPEIRTARGVGFRVTVACGEGDASDGDAPDAADA